MRIKCTFRFERQIQHEQKSFEDQKSRLATEFIFEKDRILTEMKNKENEFEHRKDELNFDKQDAINHMKKDFKERIMLIEHKNQVSFSIDNVTRS